MKIKKGDIVKIISGNDKGKQGKVLFAKGEKIVVEGVNVRKKHRRSRQQGKKGEVISIPVFFPVSRAMLVCPKCKKPTRVGSLFDDSRKKARVCKKCGGLL